MLLCGCSLLGSGSGALGAVVVAFRGGGGGGESSVLRISRQEEQSTAPLDEL